MSVKVRFAPSPTGFLHIGGARTALFNWLFARQQSGELVLRIEDTDLQRSDESMVEGILEGLEWLGIDWDEGPHFQSERIALYRDICEGLVRRGCAYHDFSSREGSEEDYRQFRELDVNSVQKRLADGETSAIRFRVPEDRTLHFEDAVFGNIRVESSQVEDFVILRSDGFPTYHLSVVADDIDMGITHVIRGADHLSNTPKHILLYEALGKSHPVYVHLPLILGTDRKRLSKRHGATSVTEYRDSGYLAEALRNYLALLGWSPGDDSELLSESDLIRRFQIERVSKANAVFDPSKLAWMNKRYISSMPSELLSLHVKSELQKAGLWNPLFEKGQRGWFLSLVDLLKSRVQDIPDFAVYGHAFFSDDLEYEEAPFKKHLLSREGLPDTQVLHALRELVLAYGRLQTFDLESTEKTLRDTAARHELGAGKLIGAVRVATTGRGQAPGIFDVLLALGKDKSISRLDQLIRHLSYD